MGGIAHHKLRQKEVNMAITLVQRNKSKGVLTWYARIPDKVKKGCVHYYSLDTTSKSRAKIVLLQRIRDGSFEERLPSSEMTLGEAVVKYEQFCRAKGLKSKSLDALLFTVKAFEHLYSKPVSAIRNSELTDAFMEANGDRTPATYNVRKTILSTMFSYFVDVLEIIPTNPIKKAIPRRKSVKAVRHFWTQDQVDRIIAHAPNPPTRLAWSLMAFAGFRVSEAVAARPGDIHDGYLFVVGKGDKPAKIPLCPRLKREIERYKGDWSELRYCDSTLENTARIALPEGFQGKAHAHRFRHSFGSNLIRAGVNVKVVQQLMRHENIKMTLDIYGHILDDDAEKAISEVYK